MLASSRLSKTLGMISIRRNILLTKRIQGPTSLFSTNVNITTLSMPSLSPTMTHGTISSWNKAPGDILNAGDILCDVETDKASVGFELQDGGVLAKILVDAKGQEIECGRPIALIVDDEADYKAFLELPPDAYAVTAAPATPIDAPPTAQVASTPIVTNPTPISNAKLSPAARHIVESQAIDTSSIRGSSKGGRIITKGDVLAAVKSGVAKKGAGASTSSVSTSSVAISPLPVQSDVSTTAQSSAPVITNQVGGTYTDVPNSNMRKVIAKRLSESKQTVPHQYTSMEIEIDALLALRKSLKDDFGVNISVNDVVIKSAALALRDVPQCNGKWVPSTGQSQLNPTVDISVAVATPNGLITPIVNTADLLGLSAINNKVKDLAKRARDGKLQPAEYQGGTFTISNLGMFGISSFSAVINPPQACILAVGGGIQRVAAPAKGKTEPRIVTTMTVQLSSDRRVVDEATASQFLQVFRNYLNNPKLLIL